MAPISIGRLSTSLLAVALVIVLVALAVLAVLASSPRRRRTTRRASMTAKVKHNISNQI